jgi:hypothetical protein
MALLTNAMPRQFKLKNTLVAELDPEEVSAPMNEKATPHCLRIDLKEASLQSKAGPKTTLQTAHDSFARSGEESGSITASPHCKNDMQVLAKNPILQLNVPEAEQKLIKKTSRHEKGSSLGYVPVKVHSPAYDNSEEIRIRSSSEQEPTTKSDPISKEKRDVIRKNCSSTDSYVSTLPPDSDCLSEDSGFFGFSPPTESLTKLSGNRVLASSPPTKCPLPASQGPRSTKQ